MISLYQDPKGEKLFSQNSEKTISKMVNLNVLGNTEEDANGSLKERIAELEEKLAQVRTKRDKRERGREGGRGKEEEFWNSLSRHFNYYDVLYTCTSMHSRAYNTTYSVKISVMF